VEKFGSYSLFHYNSVVSKPQMQELSLTSGSIGMGVQDLAEREKFES
jgi:hypothetical protein